MASMLQLVKSKYADPTFTNFKNKSFPPLCKITEKKETSLPKESVADEPVTVVSKENYYSFFDNTVSFFDDEPKEEPHYDSFTENLLISEIPSLFYSLVNTQCIDNFSVHSKRFLDDIIFLLNNSRVLEVAAISLFVSVIASLFFLPAGFNVSVSLLLSAPLFVSLCGIFAKRFKHKE